MSVYSFILANVIPTATPLHALIDGAVHASVDHEPWELPTAFGGIFIAAVAALATLYLAIETRKLAEKTAIVAEQTARLAKETVASIEVSRNAVAAEDRRHMDGFMPHLAIFVEANVETNLAGPTRPGEAMKKIETVKTKVFIRNIGPGFALNVVCSHSNLPGNDITVNNIPIAFAAHSEQTLALERKVGSKTLMGLTLTYEDAFGRKFKSTIADGIAQYSRYEFTRPT